MIGLIGFGRFGRLTARYLACDLDVYVYNRSGKENAIAAVGAVAADLKTVCAQPLVVLCVPISRMRETLRAIAHRLAPSAVVVDVCSVKTLPVQWMRDILPTEVSILATHPMFGPDSAADSLVEKKIVLCPTRISQKRYACIRDYLAGKGLVLMETTPEAHDRQIAITLALTHFIGRSLSKFGAPALDIDTEGYKRLRHILGVVENDSWELFQDMHGYNPFAAQTRRAFVSAMSDIEAELTQNENAPAKRAGALPSVSPIITDTD
ncbi:MAG: prephenate dehydrogenase/arogenate dehydrogenase family protein [Pseudomonadota bacterium]